MSATSARLAIAVLLVAVAGACSAESADPTTKPAANPAAELSAGSAADTAADGPARSTVTVTAPDPGPPASVAEQPDTSRPPAATQPSATTTPAAPVERVEVEVGVGPSTTVLAGAADAAAQPDDPFGEFAACSGLHGSVGVWALQISAPNEALTAVSILTVPPVSGAGEFPATFRLEWSDGAELDAYGIVQLDPGLQTGTFSAADQDVRGSFRCDGAATPEPLGASAVEVYALLQRGSAQRIVSLAAPRQLAECPIDAPGPVEIDAAGTSGTISRFAVGSAPNRLAIRVGETDLAIDAEAVTTSSGAGAGTFHAETADGTVIDGAYRC